MFGYNPYDDKLLKPIQTVPEPTPGASDFEKLDPAQVFINKTI